jgi:hypothetical protein
MNKNLIYIVAINFDVKEHVAKAWEYYCKKYNCDFKIIETASIENMAPHWERYTVMERYPQYENYIYVDADALVKWDCPNLFELLSEDKFYIVKDIGSLEWTYNSIMGYQDLFPDITVSWWEYVTTGFLKFSIKHRMFFKKFIEFHKSNDQTINDRQYQTLRKGFDQTPFNYFLKQEEQDIIVLPEVFSLGHMHKKDIFNNGMFLNMPAYIWQFNGIPKEQLPIVLSQIWNHINHQYTI